MAVPVVAVKAAVSAAQILFTKKDHDGKPILVTAIAVFVATVTLVLAVPAMIITSFLGISSISGGTISEGTPSIGNSSGTLTNPCPSYTKVTSEFENRINPITGKPELHGGIDLAAPEGTPIYATAGGVVTVSGWHNSYGNYVMLDHGNGMVTLYGHMRNQAVISTQSVIQGQCIGYVGSTGNSTGNHVHFEVRVNGKPENPRNYLQSGEQP